MPDFFTNLFTVASGPLSRKLHRDQLRLRSSWERYALKTGATFSSHPMFLSAYLKSSAEHDKELRETPVLTDVLQRLSDPSFMPCYRITQKHLDFIIRVQTEMAWLGGHMCHVRVNYAAADIFRFLAPKRMSAATTAALEIVGRVTAPFMKESLARAQRMSEQIEPIHSAPQTSGNTEVDRRYELSVSSNVAPLILDAEFLSLLCGCRNLTSIHATGIPSKPEGTRRNSLFAEFVCATEDIDIVDQVLNLTKFLIVKLHDRKLIEPMKGPDETY